MGRELHTKHARVNYRDWANLEPEVPSNRPQVFPLCMDKLASGAADSEDDVDDVFVGNDSEDDEETMEAEVPCRFLALPARLPFVFRARERCDSNPCHHYA